jgi:hypothetical protein
MFSPAVRFSVRENGSYMIYRMGRTLVGDGPEEGRLSMANGEEWRRPARASWDRGGAVSVPSSAGGRVEGGRRCRRGSRASPVAGAARDLPRFQPRRGEARLGWVEGQAGVRSKVWGAGIWKG